MSPARPGGGGGGGTGKNVLIHHGQDHKMERVEGHPIIVFVCHLTVNVLDL